MASTTLELQSPPDVLSITQTPQVSSAPETSDEPPPQPRPLHKGSTAVIFATVTGITGISSLLAGLVTVALPRMAEDLELSDSLLLW